VFTLGGQAVVLAWRRRKGASPVGAAFSSAASLPLVIVVVGFLLWLPTDYPHFLLRDARSKLGLARE
jgi:hypothetical protein